MLLLLKIFTFRTQLSCLSSRETLREVILMLQNSGSPHAVYIIRILRKWAKENRVLLS